LIRLQRQNAVAVEEHIENPESSDIFGRYPKILADHEAVEIICDTMRSAAMNYNDPHQVEEVLDKRLEQNFHHQMHGSHAMQTVADGLPALGIVAAVLGIIKTMGSIDQPPEVLGGLIGSALVGTFMGVFLAYGFAGPFAAKMKIVIEEDHQFYLMIREVLIANLHSHATNICIEVGRQNAPHHVRPGFNELEEALRGLKQAA
ncbi:MAG TPA: flagellar motor stator protein MotA, partial [Roseibacterium sp.]|nr:flagellar motor stator protein MotA [Roseibacterium sp.]